MLDGSQVSPLNHKEISQEKTHFVSLAMRAFQWFKGFFPAFSMSDSPAIFVPDEIVKSLLPKTKQICE